jgi:hypothetical protein
MNRLRYDSQQQSDSKLLSKTRHTFGVQRPINTANAGERKGRE